MVPPAGSADWIRFPPPSHPCPHFSSGRPKLTPAALGRDHPMTVIALCTEPGPIDSELPKALADHLGLRLVDQRRFERRRARCNQGRVGSRQRLLRTAVDDFLPKIATALSGTPTS